MKKRAGIAVVLLAMAAVAACDEDEPAGGSLDAGAPDTATTGDAASSPDSGYEAGGDAGVEEAAVDAGNDADDGGIGTITVDGTGIVSGFAAGSLKLEWQDQRPVGDPTCSPAAVPNAAGTCCQWKNELVNKTVAKAAIAWDPNTNMVRIGGADIGPLTAPFPPYTAKQTNRFEQTVAAVVAVATDPAATISDANRFFAQPLQTIPTISQHATLDWKEAEKSLMFDADYVINDGRTGTPCPNLARVHLTLLNPSAL